MSQTAQEALRELEEKNRPPTAQDLLQQPQVPATVGGQSVNTSPITLPPNQRVNIPPARPFHQGKFATKEIGPTLQERALAAAGVDTRNELRDTDIRRQLGFSPNQAFTADFLSKKLGDKYNLPPEQVVKMLPDGTLTYFDPGTSRFTTIDSDKFTRQDLADMYGPTHAIAPAIAGAVVGQLGGPWASIAGGAGGAFAGELMRLGKGRGMGVHDLDDEEIISAAIKLGMIDAGIGIGGEGLLALKRVGRKLLTQQSMDPNDAQRIMVNMQENQGLVDEINDILRSADSDQQFRLTAGHQAEDEYGIALVDSISSTSSRQRAARAAEIKAEESALSAATRGVLGLDEAAETISRSETAAIPAQNALRVRQQRMQLQADNSLQDAIEGGDEFLAQFGKLDREAAGSNMNGILNAHVDVLTTTKNDSWNAYQTQIGQPLKGTKAYSPATAMTSSVKVPVTKQVVEAHNAAITHRKMSTLANKAAGQRTLKPMKQGQRIDLAVLDDDIKELRDILRRGDAGFSSAKVTRDLRVLEELRYNYLAKYQPQALRLLEQAENATKAQKAFVNDSVFSTILKQNFEGKFVLDNVATFKAVWNDTTGAAMKQLSEVAKKQVGGLAALQEAGLRLYRANVTKRGSNVMSKDLHDKFVEKYEDVLKHIYRDPSFYKFGKFADNVARNSRRADRTRATLARSPLGKLGGANPEAMARVALSENISISNVRSTMNTLRVEGTEAFNAFHEGMGRELWKAFSTDNKLSTTKMRNVLQKDSEKLQIIYGREFVENLEKLISAAKIARKSVSGVTEPKASFIGRVSRVLFAPPLTPRGRAQSLVEASRSEAGVRLMSEALRDPKILQRMVSLAEKDMMDRRVMALLTQVGATSLVVDNRIMEE